MEAPEFETFRASLDTAGYRAVESRYDEAAFGSWLIVVDDPPARVVWDGKEGSLAVQRQVGDEWFDAWVTREPDDQTPASLAEQLALLK